MQRIKVIAIAVVVVLIVAAAGILVLNKSGSTDARDEEINLIGGLEGVGSGFYYDPNEIDPTTLFVYNADGTLKTKTDANGDQVAILKTEGWEGLVFGVPTVGSIQYYQLKSIVEVYLKDPAYTDGKTIDLKLVAADNNKTSPAGTVGYVVTQGSASSIKEFHSKGIVIGVTWEPQFSILTVGADATYKNLVTTDLLFPHVTCCVLYGNASYIAENPEVSERLVWAVMYATKWTHAVANDIINNGYDPTNEQHTKLVEYAIKYAGGSASGLDTDRVVNALHYIEYAWGDEDIYGDYDPSNPLSKIKEDIANQTDILYQIGGVLFNSYSDLGFKDGADFAESFVDDSLMQKALTVKSWDTSKTTTLKFSFIVGDLHQLPVHLAAEILPGLAKVTGNSSLDNSKTLFDQAGLDIVSVDATGSGQVVTQMQSGEADFGVAGQPGIISYDINNKLTTA